MAKILTISEILQLVQDAPGKDERIALIKKHNCLALRDVLKGGLDDSITWILPTGTPPYRKDDKSPVGLHPSTLHRQSPRLRYFITGGLGERLTPAKREKLFIEILESIDPRDAELLIAMKDKQLKRLYPCLTKNLVKSVFPNLIVK